jgi:hypothetical protein
LATRTLTTASRNIEQKGSASMGEHLDIMARGLSSPDALGAVASHVDREYGHGYRIGQLDAKDFVVRARDGATFVLRADQWGNVSRLSRDEIAVSYGIAAADRNA